MRLATIFTIGWATVSMASADFSYTVTRKSTGGMMGGMANAGPTTTRMYYKGQRLKVDLGDTATILDFDAQTITSVNNRSKTWSVRSFAEAVAGAPSPGADIHADGKETGQKKNVNGFDCSEFLMTLDVEMPQARQVGGKMQMEIDSWISSEVPGADQLKAFYQKNAARFPWSGIAAAGNPGIQQAMAEMQKKMASMNGVGVQQIIRVKAPGMVADTGASVQAAQPAMAQARARLEAMIAQGGPAAAAAKQALARMGGGSAGGGTGGNALIEMTMDSSDFSTAAIPDSMFTVPANFTKAAK